MTIFTIPKAFHGQCQITQINALRSWLQLVPRPEIILFGKDEGVADVAVRHRLRHAPGIRCSPTGTPLVSHAFEMAQELAGGELLCYLNADIILFQDFMGAVEQLRPAMYPVLLVGRRWDFPVWTEIDFSRGDWSGELLAKVKAKGVMHQCTGIDYFAFNRGLYRDLPDFLVGRPGWDNWFLWYAKEHGAKLVDGTRLITAIHQDHAYNHRRQGYREIWHGDEAGANLRAAANKCLTIADAPYVLSKDGLSTKQATDDIPDLRPEMWRAFRLWEASEAVENGLTEECLGLLETVEAELNGRMAPRGFYVIKGKALLRKGSIREAATCFKSELKQNPQDQEALGLLKSVRTG